MATQKRDNAHFRKRLKKERPDLYAEIDAGRLSVNQGRQMAGMGGKRTWLSQLKNAWTKGSAADRDAFEKWAGLARLPMTAPAPAGTSPTVASGSAFDADGRLKPWARRRILEIMDRRGIRAGDVSDELGLKRLNVSVMRAVHRGERVKESTAEAVDKWIVANASV